MVSARLFFALAEAVNSGLPEEDLKAFTDDVVAGFRGALSDDGLTRTEFDALEAAGTKRLDIWMKRGVERVAFDELATKLMASAEQVEKWKAIPESSSASKRKAEEMVFACVEGLGRTAKRLKERHQT
jgi:hypothetical protein